MKNKNVVIAGLGALALLVSTYSAAEARAGAASIRLADGYMFFANKRHIDNTSTPTIELGYEFSDKWGAKLGTTVINTDVKGGGAKSGVHGFIYTLDGVYKFASYDRFQPYVLAGAGVTSVNPYYSSDPNNQANINAGIGTQFFIDRSIALNAEAKDLYTMSGGKNDVMLTAGVTFYIGGETPEPQPVIYKDVKGERSVS